MENKNNDKKYIPVEVSDEAYQLIQNNADKLNIGFQDYVDNILSNLIKEESKKNIKK